MIVMKTGMTREEAKAYEIETIAKYRTFELGLNSTPGGDGCGSGADHPNAQSMNLYNNATGKIESFLCMRDADAFLGYDSNTMSNIGGVARPTVDHCAQIRSKITGDLYQVRYAYDETPFVKNMPTPHEKTAIQLRKKIWVFNIDTKKESCFDGIKLAADNLGIPSANIRHVLNRGDTHFRVFSDEHKGTYDAQSDPKTREWKTVSLTRFDLSGLARRNAVVAYDEDDKFVFRYDSANKAWIAENIAEGNIGKCAKHEREYAGEKNGHKLRWEYEDQDERSYYDCLYPRKSTRPFYYINEENDKKFDFKTQKDAVEKTRGKVSYSTQRLAIVESINSNGKVPCRAGHKWFKIGAAFV
jgi:hypothetical protein